MTIRNLDKLLNPQSLVLCGASDREGSVGLKMTENVLKSEFKGNVWLVNSKRHQVQNRPCFHEVGDLPEAPDLAIIAVPPQAVVTTISQLAEKGTRAGIVLTAGMRENNLQQAMLDAAKPYCFRILGPNCLGLMLPYLHLNAGFAHLLPAEGNIAFISQSGAIVGAVSDWAASRNIGFSAMISVGDMADVDVGDLLDYFAADSKTQAILLYLEQVTQAKKFMSAARSAARVKPVIVVKSGRTANAMAAAKSHTGAMVGSDRVYDAAFRRAGLVRVDDLEDLFDAVEILSHVRLTQGEKLAIVTNGGGAGVLAVDALEGMGGGQLARLSTTTIDELNACLPASWSHSNPVDIIGDASPERYAASLKAVLSDSEVNAVLIMNCPTALVSSTKIAKKVTDVIKKFNKEKTVLTSWLGDNSARAARHIFNLAGIPTFDTPADAVRGFTYLTKHMKAKASLLRVPPSRSSDSTIDSATARKIIQSALSANRKILTEPEAKAVLSAYGIPVVKTVIAKTPEEVREAAESFLKSNAQEIVLKILSDNITHKSDQGGVILGLPTAQAAEMAAHEMAARIGKGNPQACISGFTVQPMIRRPHARELIIGISEDKIFGPIILFGTGGTAVEIINDHGVSLPPLDSNLAEDLMAQTRAYRLLGPYRNIPAADKEAIAQSLVCVSQMINDLPEILELDINPLLADESGVLALDARIMLQTPEAKHRMGNPRFCIRPYPKEWEKKKTLKNGRILSIRPIRPEDEQLYRVFLQKTKKEDIYHRFFCHIQSFSSEFIARMTQIDYARSMAFVALDNDSGEIVGTCRLAADPDYTKAEYAVLVRSDMKNQGMGWALMHLLMDYAKAEGIGELWGEVMSDNEAMIRMCRELGFKINQSNHDPALVEVRRLL